MIIRVTCVLLVLVVIVPAVYAQSHNFNVSGTAQWQNTGVSVQAGQRVRFEATGSFSDHDGAHWYPPDGLCAVNPDSATCLADGTYLVSNVSRYSLVCRIGSAEGFFVGADHTMISAESGGIQFAVNDNYYGDNLGGFDVQYTVTEAVPFLSSWSVLALILLICSFGILFSIRRKRGVFLTRSA